MPNLRPYADGDWKAVLELCLLAFAPACESLERHAGADLGWKTCIEAYLRSLTRRGEGGQLVVAEIRGSVVGVVHYQIDPETRSGSIGIGAVHPARQRKGIGSQLYGHVLDLMAAQGARYATADVGADLSQAAARRIYERVGFVAVPTVHYFMKLRRPAASRRGSREPAAGTTRRRPGPSRKAPRRRPASSR
jgi:ribosomal protein S18 acetylase RimI-like enzyme